MLLKEYFKVINEKSMKYHFLNTMILTFFFKENVQLKIRLVPLEEKYHILMILENIFDKVKLGEASAKWNYSYMLIKSLSHELFTPLHQVLAVSNRLISLTFQDNLDKKLLHEETLTIKQISMCLHMTVKNMLDYANMINHTFELKLTRFHVREVLEYVVTAFSIRARKQDIQLKYECDPSVEVFTDKDRLAGLVFTFVENSIRFTNKGGILISAQRLGNRAEFKIIDSGTGIENSDLKIINRIINNPFLEDRTQNSAGLGIGFRIAQHLYKRLSNSTIEIKSEKGYGTTIQFDIPLNLEKGYSKISSTISNKSKTNEVIFNAHLDLETDKQSEFRRERTIAFGDMAKEILQARKLANNKKFKDIDLKEIYESQAQLGCIEEEKTFQLRQLSSMQDNEKLDSLSIRQLDSMNKFSEDHFDFNRPMIESPWIQGNQKSDRKDELMDSFHSPSPYDNDDSNLGEKTERKWALIVDDDAFNNDIAKNLLLAVGLRVYTADGGDSAIQLCEELLSIVPVRKIDIVLMDYYMPDRSGPDTTRVLRQSRFDPILKDTPIVGLTANCDMETNNACIKAGMNLVETKPCDLDKITRVLKYFKVLQ